MSAIGHFGEYGGRFVPEALIGALEELEAAHNSAQKVPEFLAELAELHRTYTGRPSIITEAKRFPRLQVAHEFFSSVKISITPVVTRSTMF
jgi:tryptophan synthase beta subunit